MLKRGSGLSDLKFSGRTAKVNYPGLWVFVYDDGMQTSIVWLWKRNRGKLHPGI